VNPLEHMTQRLARGVSFGTEDRMRRSFGDSPIPTTIPKPELPGYKTDEACQALLAQQAAKIDEDMRVKHALLGIGGVVLGIGIGAMLFRD
jgi:hypothetical protein